MDKEEAEIEKVRIGRCQPRHENVWGQGEVFGETWISECLGKEKKMWVTLRK
jgi:hypothetical protein